MDLALLLQAAFLFVALLCPLSIVAMVGWSLWSSRRAREKDGPRAAPVRSAADEAELERLHSRLEAQDAHAASLPSRSQR